MTTESYVKYYLHKFLSFERESFTFVLAWEIDFYIEMQDDLRCSFFTQLDYCISENVYISLILLLIPIHLPVV